ncbi:nascent polypeptide-associated complex subunit alpha, muscle-specific form-like isoform X3 [Phycodurus eques]|uniref:nascent polypeptide-associated complex subunit alpha, muscle-specific form-like isoform X3 n=1 Tax=Phycodurus eques TaxID=693459 RepID=UPI002ACDAB9F|nr:nascent polypeptide-associated complex subunit alpha, muscle-specific form-like isoform X3 [Phycodurus eques]
MDTEPAGASQSEHGPASSDSSSSSAAGAPAPPRLTPNPMLLQDSPAPTVTSSPPPPLTPAPSLSAPKMAAVRTSFPLVPAPPKLTATASPALRTYARPILPCAAKTATHASAASSSAENSSSSSSTATSSTETSAALTNGSVRTVSTVTSNTLTPFHTPASPPARQAPAAPPAGPPRADPGPPAALVARRGAPQRASLLGGGLKGSGQEQVLLRAQMLRSGTPRPAGALAAPSLRLKGPPPLSRPQTPLFPPLRPRPRPETATATVPGRRPSAPPPPTLYSPVRAVPLRPKLHSAAASRAPALGVLPAAVPPPSASSSETPPSASGRLRIVALSSARPPPSLARTPAAAPPTLSGQGALPLPRSAASPPRRNPPNAKESDAPWGGFAEDADAAPNDPRRQDADEMEADEDDGREDERARTDESRGGSAPGGRERATELREEGEDAAEAPSAGGRSQMSPTLEDARPRSRVAAEAPLPEADPVRRSPPELSSHAVGLPELPGEMAASRDIIDENASARSDNQSASSSLSSQSPPSSPSADPASRAARPLDLSRSRPAAETPTGGAPPVGQTEDEPPERRAADGPWDARAWPEGGDVLTHVVEGFVIQEGLQPFPVNRSSLLLLPRPSPPQEANGSDRKTAETATEHSEHSTDSQEDDGHKDAQRHGTRGCQRDRAVLHCQFCGKRGHAHNFMRSKRFCSTSCARGFNVRLTKRLRALSAGGRAERPRPALNRAQSVPGKPLLLRLPRDLWSAGRREDDGKVEAAEQKEGEEEEEDMEAGGEEEDQEDEEEGGPAVALTTGTESPASVTTVTASTPTSTFKAEPSQWTVDDVTAFIHALPGDRRPSVAAADRRTSDEQHEHQTGPRAQDLRAHRRAQEPLKKPSTPRGASIQIATRIGLIVRKLLKSPLEGFSTFNISNLSI